MSRGIPLTFRGLSIPRSFLWFCDCGLFEHVRLVADRRSQARADFELEVSDKGVAAYERVAKSMPRDALTKAEVALKAALERRRRQGAQLEMSDVERLAEAKELRRLVEDFRTEALRNAVANAFRGPRPKLVEIGFVSVEEDEYDEMEAPSLVSVAVALPMKAEAGTPNLGAERFHGYAPAGTPRALAQICVDRFPQDFPPKMGKERAVELCAEAIEGSELNPDFGLQAKEFLAQARMAYFSEPVRQVPAEHEPMLREVAAAFTQERLSFAKIAERLNEKGYVSVMGKLFSSALAEHVVIQSLLMLGAVGMMET
jgi:hypothetical protein